MWRSRCANTGGGGGGAGKDLAGGAGGSGIVIVKELDKCASGVWNISMITLIDALDNDTWITREITVDYLVVAGGGGGGALGQGQVEVVQVVIVHQVMVQVQHKDTALEV